MGAIYGFFGFGDAAALSAMGKRLAHRGAACVESEVADGSWLGCRASSPASAAYANVRGHTAVADADLCNGDQLAEMLTRRGHRLRSHEAAEVLIRLFLEFGSDGLASVSGHFALAIWDGSGKHLHLCRDPVGSRPLCYWRNGARLAFGSEYKALLALDRVPVRPDRAAIQQLQARKRLPPGQTLLQDVATVSAGNCLRFGIHARHKAKVNQYWHIPVDIEYRSASHHCDDLRREVLDALQRQGDCARRLGLSLSGGIDSTAIAAGLRYLYPEREIRTFTAASGPLDPELLAARQASATFGTLHREVIVGPDQIGEAIPKVVWHLEDPIARSETVQLYETVRTAAGHVDAMFGGFVADALYAGMPRHKLVRMAEVLPFLQPTLGEFYQFTQSGTRPKTLPGKLLVGGYFRGRRPVAPRVVGTSTALYLAPWPFDHKGASAEALNVYLRDGLHSSVPQWLPKVDRLVFAYGIPFFSPFMDPSVIRQAFRIPGSHKIRFWQEKYVFRQAMAPLVPRGLLARRKFPQRMLYDLSFSDALDVLADEVLSRSHVKARGFFDWQDLCRLRRRPTNKPYSAEHGMHIWTALLTEVWARLFVDGRGAAPERSFRYDPWLSDESDLRRTC